MTRMRLLVAIALVLFATPVPAQIQPGSEDEPAPATFRIAPAANRAGAAPGTQTFAASAGSGEAQARFLIELDRKRAKGVSDHSTNPPIDISFASGRFRHVAGSQPGSFLKAIAAALQAKSPKLSDEKAEVLPFDIAILGDHEGRGANGGFDGTRGDWVATKIFLADGNGEVFFNYNPVSGEAEFSIKDEDYGNIVVQELSKVLW